MGTALSSQEPADLEAAGEEQHQYLTFLLGKETFAIGILGVKEIIEYGHLTEVPMMPSFIRGVINLRGAVLPIVDLGARFGLRTAEPTARHVIMVAQIAGRALHPLLWPFNLLLNIIEFAAKTVSLGMRLRGRTGNRALWSYVGVQFGAALLASLVAGYLLGHDSDHAKGAVEALSESAFADFGRRFFALPNPMYGSWQGQ